MSSTVDTLRVSLESLRDDPDRLIAIILQQAELIERQSQQIAALQARVAELEQRLDDRDGPSAAPFARRPEQRVGTPGKPGRRPGHRGSFRRAPAITETVTMPLECCPQCRGPLEQLRAHRQIIEEIPPVCLRVVEIISYSGRCHRCGPVRSARHPLEHSAARGAAGVHLGPNATAVALAALFDLGLTRRKVCQMLQTFFGLQLSPGGLVALTHRLAMRLQPAYQALIDQARASTYLHVDETSWYIGRPRCSLWVFARKDLTLYQARESRARAVLHAIVGADYPGVLISDCLSVYDDATAQQHKCYAHHLRAIAQARLRQRDGGAGYLDDLAGMLTAALHLKRLGPELGAVVYQTACRGLAARAEDLLSVPRADAAEETVRRRLRKQQDHLFVFLAHAEVDATNNLAERQLRPAVIARKLSCGNRTEAGARSWQTLASLAATCRQRGTSFLQIVRDVLVVPDPLTA